MKKLSFFTLISFIFIRFMSAATITVTSPPTGDPWYKGDTYTIRWTSTGISVSTNMKINIFKGSITQANFKKQLTCTNTGSIRWIIPATFKDGLYYIRVKTSNNSSYADSKSFIIKSKFSRSSSVSAILSKEHITITPQHITITAPNGGESWEKGKSYTIRWQSHGIIGNVKIKLKWGTSSGGWFNVTNSTPNSGNYSYHVPSTGIGQAGNQFKIYVMTLDEAVKDESNGFFSITRKGVIHLHPPIFRFSFPKEGDVLQRGKQYTLIWKQIRETSDDVNSIKISLYNRCTKQKIWIYQGTQNKGFYKFTMPVNALDGIYVFKITPLNESFSNQSPEFKIGAAFDLSCEIRNVVKIEEKALFVDDTIGFEIWIINRGTGIFSYVPVVWRLIDKKDNRVLIQKEAGLSNIYPNKYYSSSRIIIPPRYCNDLYNRIIEVEVDPNNILHENKEYRKNNIARRPVNYNMHIHGRKK